MKICIIADLHLFSTEIKGNWSEDSFRVFRQKILPRLKKEAPDITVFLGDTLDPLSGRSDPTWPRGDRLNKRFVDALKEASINNTYILKGNHDYIEPLRNISEMGGPRFVDNKWLIKNDVALYFFSSRYPDTKRAGEDIKLIPDPKVPVKDKILLCHENIGMRNAKNIERTILKETSRRFDMILNGHEHVYRKFYGNVWCLASSLPWHPWYGNSDMEITWKDEEPEIKENECKFGFWSIDVDRKKPVFVAIDMPIKIVTAQLHFRHASARAVREKLKNLSGLITNRLDSEFEPENTVVRVHLEGTLREGDERIDVEASDIERRYYSNFYEGKEANMLRLDNLRGGGAYLSKEDLRYISVREALEQLKKEIPEIETFYEEVYDLIEKKTLDTEALIERIKSSRILENK